MALSLTPRWVAKI